MNSFIIALDLTEHALYVAVKDHRVRPPLGKLSQIYPHQLLVLIMDMWEGEAQSVKCLIEFLVCYIFISSIFFSYTETLYEPSCGCIVSISRLKQDWNNKQTIDCLNTMTNQCIRYIPSVQSVTFELFIKKVTLSPL